MTMSEVKRSNRPLVIASVMAAMFMVAVEATIVSTVMPQIVAQLGGLRFYSWVFSSFLLTQTAMTVVFGKLADTHGRKPIMLLGIGVFLIGSILAGFSWSMPSLIIFRLIQGIGAGAIQPICMTIVADLYPVRERGKIQGYLASVWAISAVLGPVAGGLIVRDLSWAWVFWINIPIGIAAAAGFLLYLHEPLRVSRQSIDVAGAALFTVAVASLLIALTEFGDSNTKAAFYITGLLCISSVLFVAQERRAEDPMISFALWSHRPIAAANGVSLLAGMSLMGLTSFLPMYVQGVLHRSAIVAGLALTMMLLGWPAGATLAARMFHRVGLRPMLIIGSILIPVGAVVFIFLGSQSSPILAGCGSLVMGFGMGLVSLSSLILIQEIVEPSQRGIVTASNIFARNLGSTLGASALGAALNYGLTHGKGVADVTSNQLQQLLVLPAGSIVSTTSIGLVLEQSLHLTFVVMFIVSLVMIPLALLVPNVRLNQPVEMPAE